VPPIVGVVAFGCPLLALADILLAPMNVRFGVKRTWVGALQMSANERTSHLTASEAGSLSFSLTVRSQSAKLSRRVVFRRRTHAATRVH
jgi:hypothetical protein